MVQKQELLSQIIEKAWSDPDFKEQLLKDPKNSLKAEFGIEIPDHISVTAVEEDSSNFYLVIPPNPADVNTAQENEDPVAGW
ncbi:NHLP leader peptide family RiPP precursor [Paenibacillus beijingensis]|uniref:Nitrile hydratase n=1 Tax=Paenibacillus beijingensis TaxID=1126833 RepID=A0A0D5NFC7_9BACL|nr:NHLP leader peptide family RiPP precursor [Paenibacillus beijingensis]AJY74099.1 nitrile hydratase [Paenibacillus beijingensis]